VRNKRPLLLVTVSALLLAEPAPAFAYLDPGTGSMLVQSLLAALAAVVVFGRTAWTRVRDLFRRRRPPRDEPPAAPPG